MGLRGYLSAVAALTALLAAPLQAQECNIQLPTGCGGGSLSHNGNEHVGGTHGGNMHGQCWICFGRREKVRSSLSAATSAVPSVGVAKVTTRC